MLEAEKIGHSEDVCTYVKSDIGMMAKGNIAPNGKKLPDPDVLLLSYTGCFTFMKWFELLREQYKCETIMLHMPYMGDGKITTNMRDYMVKQLKEEVIPKLERVSGVKFDIDRLREYLKESAKAEDDLVRVLQSGQEQAVADRRLFRRHLLHRADLQRLPRHPGRDRLLPLPARGGRGARAPRARARSRPTATWARRNTAWSSKARRTGRASASSGRCSTTRARWWSPRATPRSAASTISASATIPTIRWRRWPNTASASTPTAICRRASTCSCKYINEYEADGLLINSIKSCNSFSAGQLLMMREVEKRTGKPAAFIETDLVDPRYFSAANIKNRLESYFQMIEQKRAGAGAARLRRKP